MRYNGERGLRCNIICGSGQHNSGEQVNAKNKQMIIDFLDFLERTHADDRKKGDEEQELT